MDHEFLPESVRVQLSEIGQADLLVAIPTYNHASTIQTLVKAVLAGLGASFPHSQVILLNCDGGSQDGTPHLLKQAIPDRPPVICVQHALPAVHPLVTADHGIPGYENAFATIFQIAEKLQAQACVVFDGNLRSVTPEWVGLLMSPVTERGFDFVAPVYRRHKFDGSLTNSVIYPLNRALYGKRIHYQAGGGYGFSKKLMSCFLAKNVWAGELAQLGIENWITTVAVAEGYEVCEASLGSKIQDCKTTGAELSVLLSHAVGCVLRLMEEYHPIWEDRKGSSPAPLFGPPCEIGTEPVNVNPARMVNAFKQGLRDLLPVWEIVLSRETTAQVLPLGILDVEDFRFPIDVWVQVVFDFALAYHDRVVHREHLVKALTPLYLGRTASFIMENKESGPDEVEQTIEKLCREYEALKPYLIERWR